MQKKNKKKGLVVIYNPQNLHQFLWYYCTYGKDIEWHALCLIDAIKVDYLKFFCGKLDFFKSVLIAKTSFYAMSGMQKFFTFIKMLLYALVGMQKTYAKKLINTFTNDLDFDIAVTLSDYPIVSGALCQLSREKEIVILEDGTSDYVNRKWSNVFDGLRNIYELQGFILSLCGYANTSFRYPFYPTRNCMKFSSHPDKMLYRDYKEIKTLFDMANTDVALFKSYSSVLYPRVELFFDKKKDVILFTTPFQDYVSNITPYVNVVENYISSHFNSVLIKKHPRDNVDYDFGDGVFVEEIDKNIPAEVLLPYVDGMKLFFMDFSSIILYMNAFNCTSCFFYYNQLRAANSNETYVTGKYYTKEEMKEKLSEFSSSYKIIDLDI